MSTTLSPRPTRGAAPSRSPGPGAAGTVLALVAVLVALAVVDVVQGTAHVGAADIWHAVTGRADTSDAAVLVASRLPRMVAGLLVGAALGMAGAVLQAVSRNVLASPDTLAVNAGAYLAVVVLTVTGVSVPFLATSTAAFAGGLAAVAVTLALSGPGVGTVRLILAGSALALGLGSVTEALILLFPEPAEGLYQWGQGGIGQNGFDGVAQMAPVVAVCLAGLCALARRVDALGLGDDAARGVGVPVGATRLTAVVLGALLAAASVSLAGPIGFVGLCAPALLRPLAHRFRAFRRARSRIPVTGLAGAALVLGADVALRAVAGADTAVAVPTGIVTSLFGAVFLVVTAVRAPDTADSAPPDRLRLPGRGTFALTVAVLVAALAGVLVAAVLLGDAVLLPGDVVNWLTGRAGRAVSFILDTRVPRVLAALLAGAALALAGTLVQAVTRNPLAEPGVLGVSGGGALGAVLLTTTVSSAGSWGLAGASAVGSAVAALLVFGLSARGGFRHHRLVLVGVGVSTGATALIGLLITLTDPFSATKALIWLSGSTYGRTFADTLPVAVVLVVGAAVAVLRRRELDLVSLDEDTPRLLGLRPARRRLLFLSLCVLLTAAAVAAAGTIGFVGLVAPHAARRLVGRRHVRVVPVAMLLGAVLVTLADLLGRTVIAPAQLGAGLMTAVVGTPYFLRLLVRGRRQR